MSILNIVWSPSSVMLAVDTACSTLDGAPEQLGPAPAGPVCKLFPLPSFGAVLAGRGPVLFTPGVVFSAIALTAGQGLDFDGLLQRLPELIQGAHRSMLDRIAEAGGNPQLLMSYEFAAAGWSERRQRMAAMSFWHYSVTEGFHAFEIDETWPAVLAPRFDYDWEDHPPRTSLDMFELAQRQTEEAKTKGPRGTGGRLLIAELTRSAVTVTDYGELSRPSGAVLRVPGGRPAGPLAAAPGQAREHGWPQSTRPPGAPASSTEDHVPGHGQVNRPAAAPGRA